jgi:hypothetical protein
VFKIPNTLVVKTLLQFCILSPQHLSQEHCKSKVDTKKSGTQAIVGDDEVVLQWANCQFNKTIQINKRNNIPIMQSASGFWRYKSFVSNIEAKDREITCFDTHIIPDNESLALENSKEDNIFAEEARDQNPNATTTSRPTVETLAGEPQVHQQGHDHQVHPQGPTCPDHQVHPQGPTQSKSLNISKLASHNKTRVQVGQS